MDIKIENHELIIDGVKIQDLPRFADAATVRVYSVPTEYRESGYFVSTAANGQAVEVPASSESELIAELELEPDDDAVLARAKKEMLQRVIKEADKLLGLLEQDNSEREVKTWDQQAIESAQTGSDDQVLIDAIARFRGISKEDLLRRIIFKSNYYKETAGAIIGAKQYVEDRIEEAQTLDELFALGSVQDRINELSQ